MFGVGSDNQNIFQSGKLFVSPTPLGPELEWSDAEAEGQLAVDVFENEEELVVVATMAGTRAEDIFLHLHNDFLTIRGRRSRPEVAASHFFYEECYWGKFSRTIVLPVDVKGDLAQSEYKNGILTIHLPKSGPKRSIPILVVD